MTPETENRLRQVVRQRVRAKQAEIQHSLKQIAAGNPLGAEPDPQRRERRIMAKTQLTPRDATSVATMIDRLAVAVDRSAAGAEVIQGPTIDFVGIEFLSRGRQAANAVGRIIFDQGRARGSGFLVAPGLVLTNHHVIGDTAQASQMRVEFDYELDEAGVECPVTSFSFDAARCFVTDPIEGLDFTLVGLGPRMTGTKSLEEFGYVPLSDANDKHMLGEIANIVQHPEGRYKQLVIRENNLVARDETNHVLHYLADTEKGSSGSPVFNNQWEAIALHHWGEPWAEVANAAGQPLSREVNEGIRISAIVSWLRANRGQLSQRSAEAVDGALQFWERAPRRGPIASEGDAGRSGTGAALASKTGSDGSVTWTFPIEISVRAPLFSPPVVMSAAPTPPAIAKPGRRVSEEIDFGDRGGYEPGFIPGFVIPLPDMSNVPYPLAENLQAAPGDDPNELRYHHFSIILNAERRLACLTACNIDGARIVAVNRSDKTIIQQPTLKDLGVEAWSMAAEASDDFRRDPRIRDDEQMAVEFYEEQEVPGHAKPPFPGPDASAEKKRAYYLAMSQRTARMFQKGHLIMRGDPAWGIDEEALAAEEDTFFYTNAAPQLGFFNQGSPANQPGAKGKLRWRALETYVLRNAVTMRQRIAVFAAPIFDDANDVPYRFDSKVPMRFFKIAVWANEEGGLSSVALLADQKPVLDTLTQGVPEAIESFDDEDELARVSEFLTTVAEIERLTHFDFGAAVRDGDVNSGGESLSPITSAAELFRTSRRQRYR